MSVSPDQRLRAVASHSDFVHKLACRLLTDHARVEDVAQSALTAALRGAPDNGLRAWLAAVVRNLASKNRRSVARRLHREARSARRDRVPSADEVVERELWRQRIIAAVEELPRAQRQAVLLRFFEGLPPRRIAEQLGVPIATVKTRLKRGLENLRPKLVEENPHSGLSGLALVALGSPSSSWFGLASGPGVFLMTQTSKLMLAVVLVFAVVVPFAAWFGLRAMDGTTGKDIEIDATALEQDDVPMESSSSPVPPETRSAIEDPASPEAAEPALLLGCVLVDDTELPVAAVDVRLDSPTESFPLRTDEDGRFQLETTRLTRIVRVRIAAGAETVASSRDVDVTLVPSEPCELVLHVGRGATVRGYVLDEEDRPVARAEVLGWCTDEPLGEPTRRTRTDGEGRFSLTHIGETAYVEAHAAGRIPAVAISSRQHDGEVADGIVLRLTRGVEHVVRVVSPEQIPMVGAEVRVEATGLHGADALTLFEDVFYVRPRSRSYSATTDPSGACKFPGLPPVAHRIVARSPGYAAWSGGAKVGAESEETLVVLERGSSLGGRVLAPDGTPVAGADVQLRTQQILGAATTDANGWFRINSGQPPYGAWLSVQAQGYAVFVQEPVVLGEFAERNLSLILEEERTVAGVVLFPDGSPASGVSVTVEGDRLVHGQCARPLWKLPTWEPQLCVTEVDTDEQGRFLFGGLYDGVFRVAVAFEHEGMLRRLFVPTQSGADNLSIVLEPSALRDVVLEGRVTDATTGVPVEAFFVTVLGLPADNVDYNSPRHEFRSPDGCFAIGGLAPMDLSLFVGAPGFRDAGAAPEPRAPGRHPIDVELFPVRALELRVTDQHARPVPCQIMVYGSDGKLMWLPVSNGGMAGSLAVGADGRAILQNLPAAPLRVTVWPRRKDEWPEDAKRYWEFQFDLSLPIEGLQELEIEVPD